MLTGLLYLFFSASTREYVQINISAKALKNAHTQLLYSEAAFDDTSRIKASTNTILAWQFYKNYSYDIYDPETVQHMVLFFGDGPNSIFIDKMSMVCIANSRIDTLYQWNTADDLLSAFTTGEQVKIMNATDRMLQINVEGKSARAHLNFSKGLQQFRQRAPLLSMIQQFGAALLIAFFVFLTIYKAPRRDTKMPFRIQGSAGILPAIVFVMLLIFIFFDSILGCLPDMQNRENRSLTKFPALNSRSFFSFPEQFTTYANEHYTARNASFFMYSVLQAKLFQESVLPEKVIMGQRKWMYYYEEGSIKDFRRLTKIDSAEINNVMAILRSRIAWLEHRHIKYYVMVPPNKERIYPEFLPEGYAPMNGMGHNRLDYYKKMIRENTTARFIDPTDSLYVAKLRRDVYYHSDTHWNLYGGFIGYRCLMQELGKDFPKLMALQENDYTIDEQFNNEGDLSSMLALQNVYKRKEYLFSAKDSSKQLMANLPTEILLHYNNNRTVDSSNLKLLMFRDSYANYLIPFLNLHFKETTYIWNYEFMPDMIEKYKPDVVIFESLERFMSYALTMPNSPEMDAEVAAYSTSRH